MRKNKSILIPLVPLLSYAVYVFFAQPLPKAYYWYWLIYSYSFVVVTFGYEAFLLKDNLKP